MSEAAWLILPLLALVDASFAGYRDAISRDGRIFKEQLYRRAIRRGLALGVAVASASGLWILALAFTARDTAAAFAEIHAALAPMATIAIAYAAVVLLALGVWVMGEADARTLASTVVLGPLTLLRGPLILVMAAAGGHASPDPRTILAVTAPCLLQLLVQPWLGRAWQRTARPYG